MSTELTRPLRLGQVPAGGRDLVVEAGPEECLALAQRYGIAAVRRLRAVLHLMPEADGPVMVRGHLKALVVQHCVVSMEPVVEEVEAPVALRLLPPGRAATDTPDDTVDEIESQSGLVDLGELLAEEVSLALNPYPRHPDAVLPAAASDPEETAFGALAALQARRQPN